MMLKTYLGPSTTSPACTTCARRPPRASSSTSSTSSPRRRKKPPFGIAQTGKSFRNEITPGNFIFRTREFEQMEMEFFVKPGDDEEWHQYWIDERTRWYVDLGINPDNLRHYEHPQGEAVALLQAHRRHRVPFNFAGSEWGELEGIANRTDFDLSTHSEALRAPTWSTSTRRTGRSYTPYVIEPAAGLSRSLMTFLVDAYTEDEAPNAKGGVDKRTVLRLDPRLAPVKAAVLPLSRNADLSPKARDLAAQLRKQLERRLRRRQAIGKRYRRQDEIGTPYCITVDFDTLEDDAVTDPRARLDAAGAAVSLDQVESRVMMIFGLAPAVAPIIGGLLLRVGPWPAIFWFIGGFALLLGAAVVAVIPETHPAERRRPLRLGPMLSDLWQVARSGEFERMSWAITFVFAGQFIYIGAAAIFVVDLLGKGEGDFWMFFVPMISGVIVGSWISGRAAGRVSARRLITVGFSFSAAAAVLGVLLAVAFGPVLPWAVVGPSLIALGSGTAFPTIQVALLDLFPSVRGAAASVAGVMPLATNAVIASAVAPIVTGSVTALALTSLALIVLGCLLWVWHLAATADPSRATSQ
jgi:MFS family permease